MMDIFAIRKLKNVFVTNNCVIIDNGIVLRESCVGEEMYKKYQKPKFLLKYIFPFFIFSSKTHILVTDEWTKNYCHFLWESLSKLILMKKEFSDSVLLLPRSYAKIDFIMKSFEAFGFNKKNIKLIPKKSRFKIKNLAFIPVINIGTSNYYDFLKFNEIKSVILGKYSAQLVKNFGDKIYISRSNSLNVVSRRVSNEEELSLMLEKRGFKTVYMENFSFLEQISIMSHAKYVVAPHGAGITNVMFAKDDCHLIELINDKRGVLCFEEMCARMKISYERFDCRQSGDKSVELSDIEVDVNALEDRVLNIIK